MNFPARLFAGLPWFYYLWLLLVKTPIPILMASLLAPHCFCEIAGHSRRAFFYRWGWFN